MIIVIKLLSAYLTHQSLKQKRESIIQRWVVNASLQNLWQKDRKVIRIVFHEKIQ